LDYPAVIFDFCTGAACDEVKESSGIAKPEQRRAVLMPTLAAAVLALAISLLGFQMFRQRHRKMSSRVQSSAEIAHSNNTWYRHKGADTVVVFVHGIFSNSRDCWTSENETYWPTLLESDHRAGSPDIFLGGYYTALDAAGYDLHACAGELKGALLRADAEKHWEGPLTYPRMVFVCHSTGGIVVRYLLERFSNEFKGKTIGLLLISSPSKGSRLADVLAPLAEIYGNKLGEQLQWSNDSLVDLDRRFKDLVHSTARGFELGPVNTTIK
jgi:hypothetical protein